MNYTHLTEYERYQIDEMLREGFSQLSIAERLDRSPSTLSRELNRNRGVRGWRPQQAHHKATERLAARGRSNVRHASASAWEYAQERLQEEQWSPQQIACRLTQEGMVSISHETIYKRILADKEIGGMLHYHLRCKKKRKKRYGSVRSKRGAIPNRVDISVRPAIVERRERLGDWEGDTIIGVQDGGAVIASMVERKSRYTCLIKVRNKSTAAVIGGIYQHMRPLAEHVYTVTLDNGPEFYSHKRLTEELGADIYFARPYHSWERGLNENTNGLVRQYFPKKTSFDRMTNEELQSVADKLNNRPRKCLGYKTPNEVFNELRKKRDIALRI